MREVDFSKESLTKEDLRGLTKLPSESDGDFELRRIFLMNSKFVGPCPSCGKVWRISKYRKRPAKRLLTRRCPFCNPMGIVVQS